MGKLYRQRITAYTLPDGSHRTKNGRRVTSKTPGAVKHVRESTKWYATIGGRKVPLAESKEAALRMLHILTGQKAIESVLPHQARKTLAMTEYINTPLVEHLADYQRELASQERTPEHVEKVVFRIQAILTGCAFGRWEDLDAGEIAHYLHQRRQADKRTSQHGFGIKTSNHYIAAIRAFSRWLAVKGRTPSDPLMSLVKLNAETDKRVQRRALPPEQLKELLAATKGGTVVRGLTGAERHLLYVTAARTGLRESELASLTPQSLDLTARKVVVEASCSKRRREDRLSLHRDLAKKLRSYIKGRDPTAPLWPGNPKAPAESWFLHGAEMLRHDLEAAGLEYIEAGKVFDFHSLRHQFITDMERAGITPKMAQELARHSDMRLTMQVYTHVGLDAQAAALDSLPLLD